MIAILIVAMTKHEIWLDRLMIFPLGIPDSKLIEIQKEEVLAQLKDEIAKNGFNEHLLEDSDILSIARSKHLQLR